MATQDKKGEARNTVHDDTVWRQKIDNELHTAAQWEEQWGFMKDYIPNHSSLAPKQTPTLSADHNYSLGLPMKEDPQPTASAITLNIPNGDDPESRREAAFMRKLLKKPLLPKEKYAFPATTSSELGWAWTPIRLERYGSTKAGGWK